MSVADRPSEIAAQQLQIRSLNEVRSVARTNGDETAVTILCECGRSDCETPLSLNRDLYDLIRQHRRQSIVLTGHEVSEVDRVIQYRGTISIVESTYIGDDREPTGAVNTLSRTKLALVKPTAKRASGTDSNTPTMDTR